MTTRHTVLDFDDPVEIREFIKNTESGLYSGKNVNNQDVIVELDKRYGMNVWTLQKNNWWVIHEYDKDGYLVSESFQRKTPEVKNRIREYKEI